MAGYSKIHTKLPLRIIAMAESEAKHRHLIETQNLGANIQIANKQFLERRIGQFSGLLIGAIGLISSVMLAYFGDTTTASIVGGTTVIGLVSIFVIRLKNDQKDNSSS